MCLAYVNIPGNLLFYSIPVFVLEKMEAIVLSYVWEFRIKFSLS